MPESPEIQRALHALGRAARILEMEGHGDLTLGHVSMRDPDGRGLWMKRAMLGLGEITDHDFVLIDFDGVAIGGNGPRHNEWPIHSEIMLARPEVNFVGHTHAFYVVLMSCIAEDLRPYTHAGIWLDGPPPRYTETSELITTRKMGAGIARTLAKSRTMLIRNHGCAFVGKSVQELCVAGTFLNEACRLHVTLAQMGAKTVWPDEAEAARKLETLQHPELLEAYWQYYSRKLARSE